MISGSTSTEQIGKISIAGPTTNIVLSPNPAGCFLFPALIP